LQDPPKFIQVWIFVWWNAIWQPWMQAFWSALHWLIANLIFFAFKIIGGKKMFN
jgi:hypothetical protein